MIFLERGGQKVESVEKFSLRVDGNSLSLERKWMKTWPCFPSGCKFVVVVETWVSLDKAIAICHCLGFLALCCSLSSEV